MKHERKITKWKATGGNEKVEKIMERNNVVAKDSKLWIAVRNPYQGHNHG